jgi:hypothetical protein
MIFPKCGEAKTTKPYYAQGFLISVRQQPLFLSFLKESEDLPQ